MKKYIAFNVFGMLDLRLLDFSGIVSAAYDPTHLSFDRPFVIGRGYLCKKSVLNACPSCTDDYLEGAKLNDRSTGPDW